MDRLIMDHFLKYHFSMKLHEEYNYTKSKKK